MIICKFGGTSVGDTVAIRRLIGIVCRRAAEQPLVVVSAVAGTTDALLALAPLSAEDRRRDLERIAARHAELVRALDLPDQIADLIAAESAKISDLIDRPGGPPGPELLDAVASYGELWSSRLVAAALRRNGVAAEWIDIRPILLTDDNFTRARPDRPGLAERAGAGFLPLSRAGIIPVTQGFLGSTPDGRTTTLGRGGSDFTASLLGAALQVTRVEIWTDVDGIMTADPRLVPEARVLPVASHLEAAELAAFGAKVLHPATQAPLVEAGIPCKVLNSFAPDRPGTTIVINAPPESLVGSRVRAISWKSGVTVLNVRSPRMLGGVGYLRRLFEIVERHGVSVDVLATSEVNISFTLEDPEAIEPVRRDLAELGEVTVYPGRAIVAVVGIDLRETSGLAARIFGAVRDLNIEVISQGASAINLTFVVRESDGVEAVRRLHHEFFGGDARSAEAA